MARPGGPTQAIQFGTALPAALGWLDRTKDSAGAGPAPYVRYSPGRPVSHQDWGLLGAGPFAGFVPRFVCILVD